MKKFLLLSAAALTIGLAARAADGDTFTADNLKYTVLSETNQEVYVTGYVETPEGDLSIPAYVNNNNVRYSVIAIGGNSFSDCTGLTSVTIPNSVTTIYSYAFSACTGMISVTIPSSVVKIYSNAFSGCSGLTSVTIPNSLTSIENSVFLSCTGLTSITIPNSVTAIQAQAFYGCTSLTSVTIPNSVTTINFSAFSACSSMQEIAVEEGNPNYTAIDGILYNSDITGLIIYPAAKKGAFEIPASVSKIEDFAFDGCSGLTSVTIPNSVTIISWCAFQNCTSLTSAILPNSLTNIEASAFSGCTGLTSVTIPSSVSNIAYSAFADCSGLTKITALPATPPICYPNSFDGVPKTAIVYVPNGNIGEYSTANGWSYFTDFREREESDIEEIEADGSDAPAEYFNLSGVRFNTPKNGLYIKRRGGKTTKVLIR